MNAILSGIVGFAFGFLFGVTIAFVFRFEENNDDGENDEHLRG
jgi:hypothetical protein